MSKIATEVPAEAGTRWRYQVATGTIRQQPNGKYLLRVSLPGGRRVGETFQYRWQAEEARTRYREQGAAALPASKAEPAPKVDPGLTVAQHAADWLYRHEGRPATLDWYAQAVRQITAGDLGGRPIASVKRSDVERWVAGMRDAGVGPYAVAQRIKTLRAIMRDALGEHLINADPTADLRIKRPPIPRKQALSREESRRFVDACSTPQERVLVLAMLDAGLRFAEAAALTRENVRGGYVHVVQVVERDGRIVDTTKSGKARQVEASPRLLEAVAAVPVAVGLLTAAPNGKPWRYDAFRHSAWRRLVQDAGWKQQPGPRPTTRAFRHTFATRLAEGNVAPHDIQAAMGHADFSTTEVYLSPSRDRGVRMQAALEATQ